MATGLGLVGLVVGVCLPLLHFGGYPGTHDLLRYPVLVKLFGQALAEGFVYPRWLPDLAGGYGYPTFVFYQPVFFYLAAAWDLLPGVGPALATLLAAGSFVGIGGLGAFCLARQLRMPGLFGAGVFLLTPYLYVNFYVRGDFSELAAMLLTPWPVCAALLLRKRLESGGRLWTASLGLAAALALLTAAHPAVALVYWPVFGLLSLSLVLEASRAVRRQLAVWGAIGMLLGLALSSFYWAPVHGLSSEVRLDKATQGNYRAEQHHVQPWQLVSRQWRFGYSIPSSDQDGISFQLGAFHLVLALAGLWSARKRLVFRFGGVLYGALILLMLPLASWVWRSGEWLRLVQFPWRLLAVCALLQLLLALGLGEALRERWRKWAPLLLVVGLGWHANQLQVLDHPALADMPTVEALVEEDCAGLPDGVKTLAWVGEFLPRDARPELLNVRGTSPLLEISAPGRGQPAADSNPYCIQWTYSSPDSCSAVLNQYAFPGWRVEVDGREQVWGMTAEGRLQVTLPPAEAGQLRAYYAGPPGVAWKLVFVGLALALLVCAACWHARQKARPGSGQPQSAG